MLTCPKCGTALSGSEEICNCGQWLRRRESARKDVSAGSNANPQPDPNSVQSILKSYGKLALMLPVLVVAGIVGKDVVQARTASDNEAKVTEAEVEQLLHTYNSSLPARVDEYTVLERVSYGPRHTLQYHYDISGSEARMDERVMLERIRVRNIEQYCTSEETRLLRENGLGITQSYYRNGSEVGTATATLKNCQ